MRKFAEKQPKLAETGPKYLGQHFAFSLQKSTLAWKKYTTAGRDNRDKY